MPAYEAVAAGQVPGSGDSSLCDVGAIVCGHGSTAAVTSVTIFPGGVAHWSAARVPRPAVTATAESHAARVPPWSLAVTAIVSIQLASALSLPLISQLGAAGTAWLRLTAGALIFIAIARPPLRHVAGRDVPALLALGITTGLMTTLFLAAINHIPLGTAVAIEFLGPLIVAAIRAGSRRALVWPLIAAMGVLLLTQPWRGDINLAGVAFAAGSATCWAFYIVLTQVVGDRFTGTRGLSITMPIAAATAAIAGIPNVGGHVNVTAIAAAAGLAILSPVLPFALEMAALRRMTPTAFGTLMALEPGVAEVLGIVILHQKPTIIQIVGMALVVLAGVAAQRA